MAKTWLSGSVLSLFNPVPGLHVSCSLRCQRYFGVSCSSSKKTCNNNLFPCHLLPDYLNHGCCANRFPDWINMNMFISFRNMLTAHVLPTNMFRTFLEYIYIYIHSYSYRTYIDSNTTLRPCFSNGPGLAFGIFACLHCLQC